MSFYCFTNYFKSINEKIGIFLLKIYYSHPVSIYTVIFGIFYILLFVGIDSKIILTFLLIFLFLDYYYLSN